MYVYVLNPGGRYCNYVFCGIGVGLIHIAIGAFLMVVICYTVQENVGDGHVLLCSLGCHFFIAEGLLSMHYANGWTAPMRLRHRKFAHILLCACGSFCCIVGTIIVTLNKGIPAQGHCITGIVTTLLVITNVVIGPFVYRASRNSKNPIAVHMGFGIFAFFMSSASVCLGVTMDSFQNWAGDAVVIVTISLVVFYTAFITISAFMKCVSRL